MAKKRTRRTRKIRAYKGTRRPVRRARKAAPRRRTRMIRAAAPRRRRARNPKGILALPAVRTGLAVVAGVGAGMAVDRMTRPSWLPESIPTSAIVGIVVAGVAYKWTKGKTREMGVAAGIGMVGAGVVAKVADVVSPALPAPIYEKRSQRSLAAARVYQLPNPTTTRSAVESVVYGGIAV